MNLGLKICCALALLLTQATKSLAVGTPSAEGSILRDTSIDYFDFTIKVPNVSQTALTSKEKDLFKDRIRVFLTDVSSNYIPFEGDTPVADLPFTLSQRSDLIQTPSSDNLTDFTYSVRVTANNAGGLKKLLDEKGSGKNIKIKVKYFEDLTEKSEPLNWTISVSSAVVQDAPSGVTATGTHKALIVNWSAPTTVTWTDSSQKAPTSLTVLVIDKATTTTDVPAYIYNSSADAVSDSQADDGTCVFDPNFVEGSNCINCSDANAYLNPTKLGTMEAAGYFSKTISTPTLAKLSMSGLTNDKPYAVVLFYGPGGLNRSSCVSAQPQENHTWSEINGEDEASLLDPKCFIATAAYGSALHKNLRPLRWFRDQVLRKTAPGQAFVRAYYEHGPKAAAVIAAHPALAMITRGLLWLPVMILSAWMAIAEHSPQWTVLMLAGACVVTVAGYTLIRRRTKGA